jgi:DNA-binding Lrp family transcriptional regulator
MELTNNDRRLIAALKQNARLSISELARALGLSRTTIQKRLARLEKNKVILGYTTRLADEKHAGSFQAYVNLVVDPSANAAVISALEKMSEIESLYTVSGRIDFVAIIRAYSPAELDNTLDNIVAITGVKDTRSAIVLTTKFDRR